MSAPAPAVFDLRFDFQRHFGDRQGFAFHAGRLESMVLLRDAFLQQKIQLLPQLPSPVRQLRELLQVAPQPV